MLSDIFRSEVAGVSRNTDSLQVEVASTVGDDICSSPEIPKDHNSALRGKQSSEINTKRRSSVSELDDDESSLMSWFNRMPKKAKAVKSDKETKNAFTKQCKKPVYAGKGQNLENQSNAFVQETVAEATKGKDNGKKNNNKNKPSQTSDRKKHHGRKMKKNASSQKHDTMAKKSQEQNQIDHIEVEQGLAQINHSNGSLLQFIDEVEQNGVNLCNSHTGSLSSLLAETERNISFRHEVLDGPNGCDIADGLENYYSQAGKITYQQIFGSKDNDDACCQNNYKKEIWHSVKQKGGASQDGIPTEIFNFLQNKQKHNSFENSTEMLNRTVEAHTGTSLDFASFGEEGTLAGVSKILMEQNPQLGAIDFVGEVSGTSNKNRLWPSSQCRSSGLDCGDKPSKEKGLSNLNWTVSHINGQERIEKDASQLLQISEKLQELSVMELGKMSIHSDGETSSPWKNISSQNDSRVRKRNKAFKYETELLHASKRLQTLSILQLGENSNKSSNDIDRGYYPKNHLGRLHFKQPCGRFAGTIPSSAVEELRFCQSFSLYPSRFCETGEQQRIQDIPLSISPVEMLSKDAMIERKRIVDSGSGVTNTNATSQLPNRKQTVDFRHVNGSCLESHEPRLVTDGEYNPTVICPLNFRSNEPMSAMNLLKLMDPAVCSNQNLYASRENSHTKLLPCSGFLTNHPYGGSVLGCRRSDLENGYKQLPTNTAGGRGFHTTNPPNTYTAALKIGVPAQLFVKENLYHSNFRMLPFMTRQTFPVQDNNICCSTTPYSFIWTDRTGAITSSHGSHGNKRHIPCFQPGVCGQSCLPKIPKQPLPMRTESAQAIAHNMNMAVSVQKTQAEDIKLQKNSIKTELCVLNMNPADFTLPDENTDFMIRHGELGCRSWLQAKRRRQLITFSFWQQQRAMNLAVQNSLV